MKKLILALLAIFCIPKINSAQEESEMLEFLTIKLLNRSNLNNAFPSIAVSEVRADFQCPICFSGLDEDNNLCQTICQCNIQENPVRHVFHRKCLIASFEAISGARCPMCSDVQEDVLCDSSDLQSACNSRNFQLIKAILNYGISGKDAFIKAIKYF